MPVRRIEQQDLTPLIRELWEPFAREMAQLDSYNDLTEPLDYDAIEAYRREQLTDPATALFVVEDKTELIGFVTATYQDSPPVFARGPAVNIDELYVRPEYRTDGIGSQLLTTAEEWAMSQGADYVTLGVNAKNEPALALYEAAGYTVRRQKMDKSLLVHNEG